MIIMITESGDTTINAKVIMGNNKKRVNAPSRVSRRPRMP